MATLPHVQVHKAPCAPLDLTNAFIRTRIHRNEGSFPVQSERTHFSRTRGRYKCLQGGFLFPFPCRFSPDIPLCWPDSRAHAKSASHAEFDEKLNEKLNFQCEQSISWIGDVLEPLCVYRLAPLALYESWSCLFLRRNRVSRLFKHWMCWREIQSRGIFVTGEATGYKAML